MSKFTGHTMESSDQLSIRKHAGTDPFGNSDNHEVANLFRVSEPDFGEDAGVGRVLQLHAHASALFDSSLEVEFWPAQVRRKYHTLRAFTETAGQTDSDSLKDPA